MIQFISEKQSAESDPINQKYRDWPDQALIEKILKGDSFLFGILVRRYNDRLFRILCSYLSDEEAVKDTLQQTYMKAFEHLDSWRGNARFPTWITRIAINEALKYLNKQKRYSDLHSYHLNTGEETDLAGTSDRTPEDRLIQEDMEQLLKQAVDKLSATYKKVYIKREMEEMSTTRTAENLGISPANVKVRLHRARKKLRQTLKQQVVFPGIFTHLL